MREICLAPHGAAVVSASFAISLIAESSDVTPGERLENKQAKTFVERGEKEEALAA